MSSYVLTQTAEDELGDHLRFIAEEASEDRALRVLEKFLEAFELLADTPGIGFHRPHLTGPELRWWPVFRFLVVYDPETTPLTVMRVLHSSQNLDRLFP